METVNVTIYNSEYKLRGDDSEAIRRAASYVDQQMKGVAAKAPMQPATTTAVIAALNTAEELMAAREGRHRQTVELGTRSDDLNRRLSELADD